jgi:hypothetical protein
MWLRCHAARDACMANTSTIVAGDSPWLTRRILISYWAMTFLRSEAVSVLDHGALSVEPVLQDPAGRSVALPYATIEKCRGETQFHEPIDVGSSRE